MKHSFFIVCIGLLVSAGWSGCAKKGCTDPDAINFNAEAERDDRSCEYGDKYVATKEEVVVHYADLAFALYDDAYATSVLMQVEVEDFLAQPSSAGLNKCKDAWKKAHAAYELTEVFRFADGPIDDERELERKINAWPVTESYVDYSMTRPTAGIINDTATYPEITIELLEALNDEGGNTSISVGFHVLEFLFWGQDQSDAALKTPGDRAYTDYLTTDTAVMNAERRSTYLRACAQSLVNNLAIVSSEWDPATAKSYRSEFLDKDVNAAMQHLLTGLGTLVDGELSERNMRDPMLTKDQRLEQSETSDNTVNDLIQLAHGASILYFGEYTRADGTTVSGTSLHDLALELDESMDAEIASLLTASIDACKAIPPPFDWQLEQEIIGAGGPIDEAINTTEELGEKIRAFAEALDYGISTTFD